MYYIKVIVLLLTIILFGCDNQSNEAKKLGFSSINEMKEVHAKGWHTKKKYDEDNSQFASPNNSPSENNSSNSVQEELTDESSSWLKVKWFSVVFWSFIFLILCGLVIKIIESARRDGLRKKLNEKYSNVGLTGNFLNDGEYKQNALTEKDRENQDEFEVLKLFFTVSKPYTENWGTWAIERGYINKQAYNGAYNSYSQSHQQWQIGKASWDQQESFAYQRAKSFNQSYYQRAYPVAQPVAPNELDFLYYQTETGNCTFNCQHNWRVVSTKTLVRTQKFGDVEIDFCEHSELLIDVYAQILDRIQSGSLGIAFQKRTLGLAQLNDEAIYKTLGVDIEKGLLAQVRGYARRHDRNLRIQTYTGNIVSNCYNVPIVVLVKMLSDGVYKFIICDPLFPENVLYR